MIFLATPLQLAKLSPVTVKCPKDALDSLVAAQRRLDDIGFYEGISKGLYQPAMADGLVAHIVLAEVFNAKGYREVAAGEEDAPSR